MDSMDGLIERLRTTRLLSQRNQLTLQEEAATTLETLTQENARLREALGKYSLVTLIGMINAAGGKITVHPRDVENAVNQEVIAYYDPTNDTKVYRVRARKALGGGDES